MKTLHDSLLSAEGMERALQKARVRVRARLKVKQDLCCDEFHMKI